MLLWTAPHDPPVHAPVQGSKDMLSIILPVFVVSSSVMEDPSPTVSETSLPWSRNTALEETPVHGCDTEHCSS